MIAIYLDAAHAPAWGASLELKIAGDPLVFSNSGLTAPLLYKPISRADMDSQVEYNVISKLVKTGASVLDLGCGTGDLLVKLKREKNVSKAQGIEIDEQAIYKCVARGLSVFHGNIDSGLAEYEDNSYFTSCHL